MINLTTRRSDISHRGSISVLITVPMSNSCKWLSYGVCGSENLEWEVVSIVCSYSVLKILLLDTHFVCIQIKAFHVQRRATTHVNGRWLQRLPHQYRPSSVNCAILFLSQLARLKWQVARRWTCMRKMRHERGFTPTRRPGSSTEWTGAFAGTASSVSASAASSKNIEIR